MLRPRALLTLVCTLALAAGLACTPKRLPNSEEEDICRSLVQCWYPGDEGSQFDGAGARWSGLADPGNEQNIRRAYGADGTCWHADPMAGTVSEGEEVTEEALLTACGVDCACTIVELCAARGDADEPAPRCGDGVAPEDEPCGDAAALADLDSYCQES